MGGSKQHFIPRWFLKNFSISNDEIKSSNSYVYYVDKNKLPLAILSKKVEKIAIRNKFFSNETDRTLWNMENKVAKLMNDLGEYNIQRKLIIVQNKEFSNSKDGYDQIVKESKKLLKKIEELVVYLQSRIHNRNIFQFFRYLLFRTPTFRNFIKSGNWLRIKFDNNRSTEPRIIKPKFSNDEIIKIQENLITDNNKIIWNTVKYRVRKEFEKYTKSNTELKLILKQIHKNLVQRPLTKLFPKFMTIYLFPNLSGIYENTIPVEYILSDNPVTAGRTRMYSNDQEFYIEYFIPIGPSLAFAFLDKENALIAENILIHEQTGKELRYLPLWSDKPVKNFNNQLFQLCDNIVIGSSKETLNTIIGKTKSKNNFLEGDRSI